MRGVWLPAAIAILLFAPAAAADEAEEEVSPDDELAASQATLEQSAAATGPTLRRGKAHHPSAWPWILGGVGVAGIVAGGAFTLVSLSEQSKADDFRSLASRSNNANESAQLSASADDHESTADTDLTIGAVAAGAGAALLAAGIVWAILDAPPSEDKAAAWLTPNGVAGRF